MTDEAAGHLRKALLGTVVFAVTILAGYVLLSVYNLGFTIVGVFPVALISGLWGLANASQFVAARVSKARRWQFLAERFWLVLLVAGPVLGGLSVVVAPGWESAILADIGGTLGVDFGSFGHNGTLIAAIGVGLATAFLTYGDGLATLLIGAPPESEPDATDAIAQSVAELKRQYEAGEIDESEYERKLAMITELGQDAAQSEPDPPSTDGEPEVDIETGEAGERPSGQ